MFWLGFIVGLAVGVVGTVLFLIRLFKAPPFF